MPLRRKTFTVPFTGGIETKADPKSVPPSKLLTLENGVFTSPGRIQKRFGYTKVDYDFREDSGEAFDGHSIHSDGERLFAVIDNHTPNNMVAADQGAGEFTDVGDIYPANIEVQQLASVDSSIHEADSDTCNGYTIIAQLRPTDNLYISVVENATGTAVISNRRVPTSSISGVRVVALNTKAHVIYRQGGDVRRCIVDTEDLGASFHSVTIISSADSTPDATYVNHPTYGDCVGTACERLIGSYYLDMHVHDESGTYRDYYSVATPSPYVVRNLCCVRVYDKYTSAYRIALCYTLGPTSSHDVKMRLLNEDMTLYGVRTVTTSLHTILIDHITCVEDPAYSSGTPANSSVRVFVNTEEAGTNGWFAVHSFSVQFGADVSSTNPVAYNVMLASHAFLVESEQGPLYSEPAVWVAFVSDLQPSRFLLICCESSYSATQYFMYAAKALAGTAETTWLFATIPHVNKNGDTYMHVERRKEQNSTTPVLVKCDIGTRRADVLRNKITALTTGAVVGHLTSTFDDQGFAYFPEMLQESSSSTGGQLSDGTYYYLVTYEWVDPAGNVCRSYPNGDKDTVGWWEVGQPLEVTLTGGTSTQAVTVTVPTLQVGSLSKLINSKIVLYRKGTDGNYYEVDKVDNDRLSRTVDVDDDISGLSLSHNPMLYTTGGILGNIAPPPARAICEAHNRVLIVSADRPNEIWYSKQKQRNIDYDFSDTLVKRIGSGNPINAIAEMDGNTILFRDWDIRAFSGAGPNDFGQGSFTLDRLITTDVGCQERDSVVLMDQGLLFKSPKGFYLLTRSHQVVYIGSPVAEWDQYTVLRGMLLEDVHQVRFLLSNGEILVFDYLMKQWSVFTGFDDMVDATVCGGKYTLLKSDGSVWVENTGFVDDSADVDLKLSTAWIRLVGFHGYQRVWWIYIEGEYKSNHDLVIQLAYDHDNTVIETFTLPDTSRGVWRIKPGRQRCEAIRVTVYDANQAGTKESLNLTGLTFEVGVLPGRLTKYRADMTA